VHDPAARALVDSGRLAEPFWYVDSPLTTPSPDRPFGGRPPRGGVPAPGPGVLVPDAPAPGRRFRELCRDGFTVLAAPGADLAAATTAADAVAGPVQVLELAAVDQTGALAEALGARPGEVWVIRPDAHVAAVLVHPDAAAVGAALRRAAGTAGEGGS
jgi:pentachlorophenol monooxygenase/3-(3-hydroxy-phenyl)propionate hydroxylase